jgi:hypothetical protein
MSYIRMCFLLSAGPWFYFHLGYNFDSYHERKCVNSLFLYLATIGVLLYCNVFIQAFTRLAASMNKLSKVVSEEVPGTLSSLKLSGFEINDLTQQLTNLRY